MKRHVIEAYTEGGEQSEGVHGSRSMLNHRKVDVFMPMRQQGMTTSAASSFVESVLITSQCRRPKVIL